MSRKIRTIPTGAGKTHGSNGEMFSISDHPHGRGENRFLYFESIQVTGPSPRARGKRITRHSAFCHFRTIPTGAGKTNGRCFSGIVLADHPHGRGENPKKLGIKKRIILYLVIFQLSKNSGSNFQNFCRYEIKHSARTSPKTPQSSLSLDEKSSADTASR